MLKIIKNIHEYVMNSPDNYINSNQALTPEMEGLLIYDAPLIGFASSDDPLFEEMKNPDIIGPHFRTPAEWLPDAKSVISIFMPYTDSIKKANAATIGDNVSLEWFHGRIEGHSFLIKIAEHIKNMLTDFGYTAVIPSCELQFTKDEFKGTSNWSERHIAYICGLGTFGLSKGLITEAGTAGRVISIVTNAQLPATERKYTDIYEYCNFCGACIDRCPVHAISLENGKEKLPCEKIVHKAHEKYPGYYGCGKCQTGVPCESKIPAKKQ